jgi:hypothetical protein
MTLATFPWSAVIFGLSNLIALLVFWGNLSARLTKIELTLADLVKRPAVWCEAQQAECRRQYEPG